MKTHAAIKQQLIPKVLTIRKLLIYGGHYLKCTKLILLPLTTPLLTRVEEDNFFQ